MTAKREGWLDGLKGFAILLVILGHVLSGYLDANTFPDAYYSFYRVRSAIYSFHMPLFFLISGFTFTLAYFPENQLRKRGYARQLLNLFWIYTLFALLLWGVKQLIPELVNETYTLEDLKTIFVTPLGNFWYLYVLLVFYLLAGLLQLPRWPGYWLLLLGGGAVLAADWHMDWYYLTPYRIIYHLFFFGVGCGLSKRRALLRSPRLLGISLMFLSTAAAFHFYYHIWNWYANWKLGIALALSYVLTQLFFRLPRLSGLRLFQLCGKYCLELYLLHIFFTAGFRSLLPLLGVTAPWVSTIINFLLSTALSLVLAVLARKTWVMDAVFRPARFLNSLRKRIG